jgi:hypothetical protein
MSDENCDVPAPKLPRKGSDGQEICDVYGNRWVYDLETRSWISKGVVLTPPVVSEENDGIVTPHIFNKLTKLREFSKSDLNASSLKLLPGTDAYWYYFRSSDKMFRFKPEGQDSLRIEVDAGRIYQVLLKQVCPGPRGLRGPQGDPGIDGVPGPPELRYAPIFSRDRIDFTIFTPAPLVLGGLIPLPNDHIPTISVRLFESPNTITNLVVKDQVVALAPQIKNLGGPEILEAYSAIRQIAVDQSLNIRSNQVGSCVGAFNEVLDSPAFQSIDSQPLVVLDISPINPSEKSLTFNSILPIDTDRTLASITYDQELKTVCGSIFLLPGSLWDVSKSYYLKSRQRGPDGIKGEPAECRIRIIECSIDDSNILADCPIVNIRLDCDEDTIYTICSNLIEEFCVEFLTIDPGSAAITTGNSLKAVFGSAQMSLAACKQINRFEITLPETDIPELDLVHWEPQPGCFTRRHYNRYKFDWVPLTNKPACDIKWFSPTTARPGKYPHELLIAPPPPEDECCQDDFFYCPNVQDAPCIDEPPPPPPPPSSPSISAALKASDIHNLEIKANKSQQVLLQGVRRWNVKN